MPYDATTNPAITIEQMEVAADAQMRARLNEFLGEGKSKKLGLIDAAIKKPNDFSHNTAIENNLKKIAPPTDEKLWPANEQWSSVEKQKEALYLALHGIDWAQTRHLSRNFANNPDWHEQNPILGMHPSTDAVDAYFAATGLAHLYVADKLPEGWRKIFQNLSIGVEAGAAGNNERLGLKAKF